MKIKGFVSWLHIIHPLTLNFLSSILKHKAIQEICMSVSASLAYNKRYGLSSCFHINLILALFFHTA